MQQHRTGRQERLGPRLQENGTKAALQQVQATASAVLYSELYKLPQSETIEAGEGHC